MNIINQLHWRYATKKFDVSKKLDGKQIETLKEAFNLTALSYGLQTLKLITIENNALRESLIAYSYGQRQVADASHLLILCIQTNVNEDDVNLHFDNIKSIRNTPVEVLKPFKDQLKSTITAMSESQKTEWATRQAYIALGNLMTVCAVEKIDSCPMEGFDPEAYSKVLSLQEKGLKPVLLLPVGLRAEDDMFSTFKKVRKPVQETVIEL